MMLQNLSILTDTRIGDFQSRQITASLKLVTSYENDLELVINSYKNQIDVN